MKTRYTRNYHSNDAKTLAGCLGAGLVIMLVNLAVTLAAFAGLIWVCVWVLRAMGVLPPA